MWSPPTPNYAFRIIRRYTLPHYLAFAAACQEKAAELSAMATATGTGPNGKGAEGDDTKTSRSAAADAAAAAEEWNAELVGRALFCAARCYKHNLTIPADATARSTSAQPSKVTGKRKGVEEMDNDCGGGGEGDADDDDGANPRPKRSPKRKRTPRHP